MTKETELKLIQQEIKDLESLLKALEKSTTSHYKLGESFLGGWATKLNGMKKDIDYRINVCRDLVYQIRIESKKVSKKKELV
jgi:hypothetical protein